MELEKLQFTQKQLRAINFNKGPVLVVAGAGTGKTAVITQRIARLILESKAKPSEILALTFTEKAAAEMQQRTDELLPYGYLDTQIMTFHSLAEKIMREFALDAGISPEFQILNDVQQTIIMQEVLSEANFKYFSPQHDPFAFISAIKSAISRLKDEGIDAFEFDKQLKALEKADNEEEFEAMADLASIYTKYSQLCMLKNSLDFGDLLIKLQHLLKNRKSIKSELNLRYKYVLVDEFQDTNSIQMEIIEMLLDSDQNIMVVGDDDQAIYQFRGASVKNILSFRKKFKQSQLIVLKDNFRSGQQILDSGYNLIQHNNPQRLEIAEGIDKKLIAHKYPDASVGINEYANKIDEVDGVVDKIESLISEGADIKNIAILLRKNNQIKSYILALQKKKIAYYVHQDVELFDQKSVKMLVALAKTIIDPFDSASLFGLIMSGFFGEFDKHKLIELSARANRTNELLFDVLREEESDSPWILNVINKVLTWRETVADFTAGELLFLSLKDTGYLKSKLDLANSSVDAAMDIQYMTDFFKLIKQFEQTAANSSLLEFCKYLDEIRLSSADVMSEISPLDEAGVQIMTVHKSKGLEFDYVFLPELTEQTFPTYRRAESIKIPDAILDPGGGDHYQEERRLFYVALTRARKQAFLSFARDHGQKRLKRSSRFIDEALGQDWQKSKVESGSQRSITEIISSFEPTINSTNKEKLLARLYRGDWLYLTTNQVADYLRSPREFWLFHVLQLPKGPFHTLVYGSSIHAALEHFYKYKLKNKPVIFEEVLDVYANAWKKEGFVSVEHEKKLFDTGKKAIIKYIKAKEADEYRPIAIEQPFELQIPEIKTIISGRYDIVLESKAGIEIRDFKTSRVKDQKMADSKAKSSIQLGIYALSWDKLQQKTVSATSLEFIEDLLLGKNVNIDNEKTLEQLNSAIEGIKSMKFDDIGQSFMDFDKLLI